MKPKAILFLAPLLLPACTTGGDFRRIALSADLASGDLAYFRARAEATGTGGRIEDTTVGFPLLFLPLFSRVRETSTDRGQAGEWNFHVEDDFGLGWILLHTGETASFDGEGRCAAFRRGLHLLLGLLHSSAGHARGEAGGRVATSRFSLLWDAFSTERTPYGRSWTFLWFPIVSAER